MLTVILDYIEAFSNRLHHPREDRYLFSALRRRSGAAESVLDELEEEHRIGDELTCELRYLLTRCRVEAPTPAGSPPRRSMGKLI